MHLNYQTYELDFSLNDKKVPHNKQSVRHKKDKLDNCEKILVQRRVFWHEPNEV